MEVGYLALFISIINLFLLLRDRFPRAYVAIETEVVEEDTEYGPSKIDERLWITISNQSAKRIFITGISAEWSKHKFFPYRYRKINLEDLQRWESNDKLDPTTRFWIEPWGNVVLSADADDFKYKFYKQLYSSGKKISYRVVVYDGLQKSYKSNRIILNDPNLQLLKPYK
jgi:hypothetical protein